MTLMVSVIIPNYNHAPYLEKRLNSVFNQSYQDFEVILLDDCSTDSSLNTLKKYADHPKVSHCIINEKNSGSPFAQWKKGLELAKGEYVWIAESDDWAELTFLEELLPLLKKGFDIVYCRSVRVMEEKITENDYFWADGLDKIRWKKDYVNNGLDEINNYLVYRNTIPNASACLFKNSFSSMSSKICQMKFCGDWLFWVIILSNKQSKIAYTPSRLNYFRKHNNTSRSVKDFETEKKRAEEYFKVINIARKLSRRSILSPTEYSKYNYFFNLLNSSYGYERKIIQLMSIDFCLAYFLYIIKKNMIGYRNRIIQVVEIIRKDPNIMDRLKKKFFYSSNA